MIPYTGLPHLNAFLNAISALLLLAGYFFIRRKNWRLHRAFMLSATITSALFLISYLVYHYRAGTVHFQRQGWLRPVYFVVLGSHTILAALILPLVLFTLRQAWKGRFGRHRKIARWTLPLWLYVSITGVIVYVMLYHL
jgi:putative membrane protein